MPLPTHVSTTALVAGTGNLSVTWGTHAAGDLGFIVVETGSEAVSTPSGWTLHSTTPISSGGVNATRLTLFYKFASSSSEAAVTITDPGDHALAVMTVWRGVDTTNPFSGTAGWDAGSLAASTTTFTVPSVTTAVADCVALAFATDGLSLSNGSTASNGSLANLTVRSATSDLAGNDGGIVIVSGEKAVAGATGGTTITWGSTAASNVGVAGIQVAIRPTQSVDTGFFFFF